MREFKPHEWRVGEKSCTQNASPFKTYIFLKYLRTHLFLSLLLLVWPHPAIAEVPSGYLSTDQITGEALNSADRSAVILIHGWNPDEHPNHFTEGDWPQLVSALSTKLNGSGTKLLLFRWEEDASTGPRTGLSLQEGFYNGWAAAENASTNGMQLAGFINTAAPELRELTLIAHSAGSWAAYRVIDRLLRENDYVVVNLVLLDPFIPGVDPTLGTTLTTATMSQLAGHDSSDRIFRLENYYAIDTTDHDLVWLVNGGGSNATSQEFTWRNHDINHRTDYISLQGFQYDGHGGPIRFYADTVTATTSGATVPDGLDNAPWSYQFVGFYRSLAYLPGLPRFIVQPQAPAQPVQIGQTVTLPVSAHFADSFQWFKDSQQYPSTDSTLWINSVSVSDAGEYVVRVTNANGHTFSEKTVLQVAGPSPVINSVSVSPDLGCLGFSNRQWITINGQSFLNSSTVILNDGTTAYNIPEERTEYIEDTHIRVCAGVGYTSDWTAQVINPVNSSNEYAFTVPVPGAPTVSISAAPSSIASGSSSSISWSSTNSISCAASGGWAGAKSTSGSQSVTPGSTTTYTLTCTGSGGSANSSTTVTVSGGAPAPSVYLSATPDSVSSGQQVSLGWATSNATSCSSSWGGSVPLAGNATVNPSVTTTYTLTCSGAGGLNSDSETVSVGTLAPVSLTATPPAIPSGGSSTLSWSTNGMASCLASVGWSGSQPLSGNTSVSPSSNTTYTLTCTGSGGTPTELVQNGAFAGSTTQWTKSGNFYADSRFGSCNSCSGYAYLSGSDGSRVDNLSGVMLQAVSIPAGASSVTLSFWVSITSDEYASGTMNDYVSVNVVGSGGTTTIDTIHGWFVGDWGPGIYRQRTFDLTGYAGQNITLYFNGVTNGSLPTVFRIDDVSITSTVSTQDSDSTTVTVIPPSPPTLTFTAAPDHINSSESSVLSWSSANTTSCSASGGWSGTRGISGSETVYPTQDTTYSLSCTGSGGTVSGNATVAVTPPPPTVNLSVSSTTINEGDTSTLSWTSTNATSCTPYGEWGWEGSKAINGSQIVSPTNTASYTLSCSGANGTSSDTVTINVVPHNITITGIANGTPNPVDSGGTINLSVSAGDSFGHGLNYVWSASCPGLASNGVFNNANIQNPTWIAPANTGGQENCTISVAVSDGTGLVSSSSYFQVVGSAITTYTLNISATNGAVSKSPDLASYSAGSQVTLTPTPDSGYQFDGWGGDASGTTNPLDLTMDGNKNITANFITLSQDLGSIYVSILPQAAADAGAQWRVVGESTWRNSGTIYPDVPYATYHIEFSTVSGWSTPSNKEVTVSAANQNPLINSDNYIEQPLSSIEAPSNLQAVAVSNSSIALTWADNSDNEEAFILEMRVGMNGSFNHRVDWNPNSISWIDDGSGSGLEGGVIYCYRVRAWASALGYSNYANEACATTPLAPDLVVLNPSVNASTLADGELLIFSVSVKNQGPGPSNSTTLRYYKSNDLTISTSDIEIWADAVESLPDGNISLKSTEFPIAASTSPGIYWIGACVDTVSGESLINNQCSTSVQITVTPLDSDGDGIPDVTDLDDDNDGLPDNYENQYAFLNPLNASDAGVDQDDDGLTNLQEYQAGSDPTKEDTDRDGLSDKYELDNDLDPTDGICPDWVCGGGFRGWRLAIPQINNAAVYTLTVNVIGTGNVTSAPAGINCDVDCVEDYSDGTLVTLTATSAADHIFTGWSGDCSGTGTCTITMNQAHSEAATFELDTDGDGIPNPQDPDDDSDGLPDSYENQYAFLDPLNASDAIVDQDGDGLTNLQEYQAGSDPTKEDTDRDGLSDKYELDNDLDPMDGICPDWICGASKGWRYAIPLIN